MDDSNALSETDGSQVIPEFREFERSVEDAKVSLVRLLVMHKELSKRLDSLSYFSRAKEQMRRRVHVSVLDPESFSFASPTSWKFQTPSPIKSESILEPDSHRRIWSVTTCRSPDVSEFRPLENQTFKKRQGLTCLYLVFLVSFVFLVGCVFAVFRLRTALVVG